MVFRSHALVERLNIKYPIIQAGMAGGTTTPELVAAVSNAGGLGTLGAGYMTAEQMTHAIRRIKDLTYKPFSVNLFVPDRYEVQEEQIEIMMKELNTYREDLHMEQGKIELNSLPSFEEQFQAVIDEDIPVFSYTFGTISGKWVERLKSKGIFIIGTATTVNEAIELERCEVDAVVAQGSEAGGHRGTFADRFDCSLIGSMALIPQVVDKVKIPVIAAGGIMDGRGVVASMVLGASAVQMGSAFLTTKESGAHTLHKKAILQGLESETVITSVYSGKPARGMATRFITEMESKGMGIPPYPIQNTLTSPIRKEAGRQNRPEFMSLWSGQAPRLSRDISVGDFMSSIIEEIEAIKKTHFI